MSKAYVDGIQTGQRGVEADISTVRVHQSVYGQGNGEVHLEFYTFSSAVETTALNDQVPFSRMTLDIIGARKLISELASAFNLDDVEVQTKHRTRHGDRRVSG